MQIRTGFVSNSSSSSFVIPRDRLSEYQVRAIENHLEFSEQLTPPDFYGWLTDKWDGWQITVNDDKIEGYTTMNNFDMEHFLHEIGVPDDVVVWDY